MSALSDLIAERNTKGWSQREIQRRMAAAGHRTSIATVNRCMRGNHGSQVDADTLRAFSDVLSIPMKDLLSALQLPNIEIGPPFELDPDAAILDAQQRDAVRAVVRSMIQQNKRVAELESNQEYEHSRARESQRHYGLAAFEQGLGAGIGPDDVPEES